jgi:hypothetical protein
MQYVRLCGSLSGGKPDGGKLLPINTDLIEEVEDINRPYYASTFFYNDSHYKQFQNTGSISGITDVTTNKLYWDFDSKDNLELARQDAITMCARLQAAGIPGDQIFACFSGFKGFSVEISTDRTFTPKQVETIALKMADGLSTVDSRMYNAARVFRLPGTKHAETGLFKFPLSVGQLSETDVEDIKLLAIDINNADVPDTAGTTVALPDSIFHLQEADKKDPITTTTISEVVDLDFKNKPRGFSNCKFAILNGFFPNGRRNDALSALAATLRAQHQPKEIAYNMLKGAARLQTFRYGSSPFSKKEMWTAIEQVYSDNWKGGQYSCKTQPWLKEICDSLGIHKCKASDNDSLTVSCDDVFGLFKKYAENFEKNVIKTGIQSLDDRAKFLVGTSNGILAPPGVGKTSLSLNILNHTSENNIHSVFFSYDMYHSMVYLRLIQKHTGWNQDKIFNVIKSDPKEAERLRNLLKERYRNVHFCFKSGQSPDDIRQTILETEESAGEKVRLCIVDYNELVSSPYSDATASSAFVAQGLRQVANETETCMITLLQPAKHSSNPADEASSYQATKGSSAIVQSLSLLLSMSRPGFAPRRPEEDIFLTLNCLKHRHGPLFSLDLSWEGLRGTIGELSPEDEMLLKQIRERKEAEKESDSAWG